MLLHLFLKTLSQVEFKERVQQAAFPCKSCLECMCNYYSIVMIRKFQAEPGWQPHSLLHLPDKLLPDDIPDHDPIEFQSVAAHVLIEVDKITQIIREALSGVEGQMYSWPPILILFIRAIQHEIRKPASRNTLYFHFGLHSDHGQ